MRPNSVGKQKEQWSSILLRDPNFSAGFCKAVLGACPRNNIFGIQIIACNNKTSILSRAGITIQGCQKKPTWGQKATFIKFCLLEQISSPLNWVNIWPNWAQGRGEWLSMFCPRVVSLVCVSLTRLRIFRSSLSTLSIWSLYDQNREGPPGSLSWNPSPGTNSWNPSAVGRKLLDFYKILPSG